MAACRKALYVVFSLIILSDVVRAMEELGPCQACKVFVEAFEKGRHRNILDSTENQSPDILQGLCEDPRTKSKCLETADLARPFVDQWLQLEEAPDFFNYICIDKLEVCCPKHHYGRQCLPCQGIKEPGAAGEPVEVCSGHGKCRGDGTRKGNGTCLCDAGYEGELCGECVAGFYVSHDDLVPQCKRCHYSCAGGCRSGTPRDCVACKPGFLFDKDTGCQDINECDDINVCTRDQFCLNLMGSHNCVPCDKACKGCYGNTADMCRKCAAGYLKKGEFCVKEREDEESDQMAATRYMTYLGLLVAGGVLYPRTPALAAGVGALTLSYIVLAEYYCLVSGHASLLDLPLFTI